ncbi:MAG TPA: Cerebroside-sulfatase, partial [Planctomycetaceae bacterium]|nr:Cerebroside-sulfatase [Planctomycetaceae bacterium]
MLTLAAGFVDQAFAKKPTNVILILADDVGFEGLGCFGGRSYQTPRLDDLASQGMKAMHCYSMAVCHPTRVCLLTGKYPFRTKNPKWGSFPKDHESTTIASVLKDAGYRT